MRHSTLVTGGSDGSVRVWSLDTLSPIHRLAAHDNSVTSLQFNESRIISGGSDGRVKVWDLKTGTLVRELSQPAEAVWRVVFEEEKAVVMASRNQRTVMEVWNFAPPEDELALDLRNVSRSATASPSSPSARIMAELGTGMEQLLNRNVDRNPTNLLLTSAFVPPPSAPPAPTIMPVEAFPNLERQQSSSVKRQQASRQPIPQYSEQQHTRQVTQWNEQTAADLDALYGAGPSNFGAGGDAAANIGGSELRRHYSQHVATAGSPPPASTTVAPVTNVASPSPLARARSSWLQLNGSSGGRG
jgi:WD40 repeat protein